MSPLDLPPSQDFTPKPAAKHPLLVCLKCKNDDASKFTIAERFIHNVMSAIPEGDKLLVHLLENVRDDAKYLLVCGKCSHEFDVPFDKLLFE